MGTLVNKEKTGTTMPQCSEIDHSTYWGQVICQRPKHHEGDHENYDVNPPLTYYWNQVKDVPYAGLDRRIGGAG